VTDLISREALIEKVRGHRDRCINNSATYGNKDPNDEDDWERMADDYDDMIGLVKNQPAVVPQIFVNVTGGIAEPVCADYPISFSVLDYDITPGEDDERHYIDEHGDEVWIYGDSVDVDPAEVELILSYPTVMEARSQCLA
jgi:hypothetical protein